VNWLDKMTWLLLEYWFSWPFLTLLKTTLRSPINEHSCDRTTALSSRIYQVESPGCVGQTGRLLKTVYSLGQVFLYRVSSLGSSRGSVQPGWRRKVSWRLHSRRIQMTSLRTVTTVRSFCIQGGLPSHPGNDVRLNLHYR